jgi:hypothetical protein
MLQRDYHCVMQRNASAGTLVVSQHSCLPDVVCIRNGTAADASSYMLQPSSKARLIVQEDVNCTVMEHSLECWRRHALAEAAELAADADTVLPGLGAEMALCIEEQQLAVVGGAQTGQVHEPLLHAICGAIKAAQPAAPAR